MASLNMERVLRLLGRSGLWAWDLICREAVSVLALAYMVMFARSTPAVSAVSPNVQLMLQVTFYGGSIWLMYWAVMSIARCSDVSTTGSGLLRRIVILAWVQVFMRDIASMLSEGVRFSVAQPEQAVCVAMGVGFLLLCSWLVGHASFSHTEAGGATRGIVGYASSHASVPRSSDEIRRTAVHESGHLLLYAALPALPQDLVVSVASRVSVRDAYRGFVRATGLPTSKTEAFLNWQMCCAKAGDVAEAVTFGDRSNGLNGDMSDWLAAANEFFSTGLGEVFYADPQTQGQAAHNRLVLDALSRKHVGDLVSFFCANKALLMKCADYLVEHGSMSKAKAQEFLGEVIFTSEVRRLRASEV